MKMTGRAQIRTIALLACLGMPGLALTHNDETHDEPPAADGNTFEAKIVKRSNAIWGKNYFPNYTLTTHEGEKVKFFDDLIESKIVAINFVFTRCGDSCPVETARLLQVAKILGDRLGRDIFFYSISIDPENDTPDVLKAYRETYGIDEGWTFLTGDKGEIDDLRVKLGLFLEGVDDNSAAPDDHNISLIIGNQATGRWMKRSPFEDPHVLSLQINDWLSNWKNTALTEANYANAPAVRQEIPPGEKLFRTRCRSCHKIGEPGGLGPDLLGVNKRRDPKWLARWIKEPDKMIAEGDPLANAMVRQYRVPMPNQRLSDKDVTDLLEFISDETRRLSE